MCSWNWGKFKIVDKEFLYLDSLRQVKMYAFLFSFHSSFPLGFVFMYISLMQLGKESNKKISATVHQKKIKSSWKEYVTGKHNKIWPMKNIFWKLEAKNTSIMICSQNYWE